MIFIGQILEHNAVFRKLRTFHADHLAFFLYVTVGEGDKQYMKRRFSARTLGGMKHFIYCP
jgi:hypothetical protein